MTWLGTIALAAAIFGAAVYLAARAGPRAIALSVLILATIVPLGFEGVAAYQLFMAIRTNSFDYAFADLGFAVVTMFNLIWLPAMGFGYWLGRRHRRRGSPRRSSDRPGR